MTPREVPLPTSGAIAPYLPGAFFADAWSIEVVHPERTALQHFEHALRVTPGWVRSAMQVRNAVVARLGLKRLDTWDPQGSPAVPGAPLGAFEVVHVDDDEVIAGDTDKHLRVVLSLQRHAARPGQPARVTLTTVVHLHNLLGRLYMLPVAPAHRWIAPRVLRGVNAKLPGFGPGPAPAAR